MTLHPLKKPRKDFHKAIDEHLEKQYRNVCYECGVTANVITCLIKYHDIPKKIHYTMSTYHEAKCDYCKKKKMVTEARDFFYPNFNQLTLVLKYYKDKIKNAKSKRNSRK